ncbi:MAG: hypothetical protein AAF567_12565 [Actinomycetota bacterium]
MERTEQEIFDDFVNGRLGKDEWTHDAHLITCFVALQDRSPVETLAYLRDAIQTHNCGIGIRNTDTMGYHETLTRYYVTAVAQAMGVEPTLDHVMSDPHCSRTAPLDFWSRERLFSVGARLGWLEPEHATPWPIVSDEAAARHV